MKKIVLSILLIVVLAGGFMLYNSKTSVADDKDKCCNTNCPKYAECDKKCADCTKQCENKSEDCKKQCETKKEGQSQMNGCPKTNCQQNDGTMKSGSCPKMKKQQ